MPEYRQDDRLGVGYCPRCYRAITLDTALFGVCSEHGRVPADFFRPLGWTDPDMTAAYRAIADDHRRHMDGEPGRYAVRRAASGWQVVDTATGDVAADFGIASNAQNLARLDADARNAQDENGPESDGQRLENGRIVPCSR